MPGLGEGFDGWVVSVPLSLFLFHQEIMTGWAEREFGVSPFSIYSKQLGIFLNIL